MGYKNGSRNFIMRSKKRKQHIRYCFLISYTEIHFYVKHFFICFIKGIIPGEKTESLLLAKIMAKSRFSLEADDKELNDPRQNKLSLNKHLQVTVLGQCQSFKITPFKIVLLFLLKRVRFSVSLL